MLDQPLASLRNLRVEQRGFDLRDDVTLLDQAVKVSVDLLDRPRHLASDQHRDQRAQGAGGGH